MTEQTILNYITIFILTIITILLFLYVNLMLNIIRCY